MVASSHPNVGKPTKRQPAGHSVQHLGTVFAFGCSTSLRNSPHRSKIPPHLQFILWIAYGLPAEGVHSSWTSLPLKKKRLWTSIASKTFSVSSLMQLWTERHLCRPTHRRYLRRWSATLLTARNLSSVIFRC